MAKKNPTTPAADANAELCEAARLGLIEVLQSHEELMTALRDPDAAHEDLISQADELGEELASLAQTWTKLARRLARDQ